VTGDDGRLELVRPGPLEGGGAGDQPAGVGDALVVPPGPVLIGQLDELAVLVEPGRRPGPVQPDQGQQPGHLGLGGHELVEQRREKAGVIGEVAGLGLSAPAGQVALVEQQVDDGQDLGQAGAESVSGRDPVRDARVSDLPLGAGDAPCPRISNVPGSFLSISRRGPDDRCAGQAAGRRDPR
jgi:hypothetical protein